MLSSRESEAQQRLDQLIRKARVHFYKPIQIAEILYHSRVLHDVDLNDIETYRTQSKKWRDTISQQLVGRDSNSSSRYQDDLLIRELPSEYLVVLGEMNYDASIEKYIYSCFNDKLINLQRGMSYINEVPFADFYLKEYLNLFRKDAGLARSVDKVFEIIVYALFNALVDVLGITITVNMLQDNKEILQEFRDFSTLVMNLDETVTSITIPAQLNRVGVTNAADRGLDMWANFGLAIQIKHLSLTEELAENIVDSITADRIVIVCKDAEQKIIISLLNQIGWKSRIQSIITEDNLIEWYEKAMRGKFSSQLGPTILRLLNEELQHEFPSANAGLKHLSDARGYNIL